MSTAVCIALQTRQNVHRDDHAMVELRSNNQPGSVAENQTEGATQNTPNDPYYSTIRDEEDEPIRPYGMAKAGAQYGRAEKRSRSVSENAITGPRPRSERNKCYNQAPGEDTVQMTGYSWRLIEVEKGLEEHEQLSAMKDKQFWRTNFVCSTSHEDER
uniref:Uncharacterized protein n=1 Tax=Branchiostoma floridae TaxID=7739 RepID=C3ZAY1_BRAFL|eukprot:XP_002594007.1 hypothetical protein BRAFLDRAFT_68554 [Branchiostoma floridae]